MRKYEVVWDDGERTIKTIVEAETGGKATYKLYKSQLGVAFIKKCKFRDFLKYFHNYTSEVK